MGSSQRQKEENRFVCTVDWFEPTVEKVVPAKHLGIFQSVAGPFKLDDDKRDWLINVFGL